LFFLRELVRLLLIQRKGENFPIGQVSVE
jgi:hypothetical protein